MKRIVLVAGELSGDQLGGSLVAALKKQYPTAIIEGIGGPQMQAAGLNSLFPMETLSVMGISEVLGNLWSILSIRRQLLKHLHHYLPDVYIGIDAPDFNLPVEQKVKALGVKTLHYVSPSVWAWREGRMKKIKKATDSVLAILPFEEAFYQKHQHRAVFVGHPLAKSIAYHPNQSQARQQLNIPINEAYLAILPGSRQQEVKRLLPILIQAVAKLKQQGYQFKGLLPVAKPSLQKILTAYQTQLDQLGIYCFNASAATILEASDWTITASGTATLQAMLYKQPMVVAYRVSWLSKQVGRFLIKTPFFALPNILANRQVVKELIQDDCTADQCYIELKKLMDDANYCEQIRQTFLSMHQQMDQDTNSLIVSEVQKQVGNC